MPTSQHGNGYSYPYLISSVLIVESAAAAALAETRKFKKYLPRIPIMYQFCPFAVETLGTSGESDLQVGKRVGKRLNQCTGENRSRSFLIPSISIATQRGNAASIIATIPKGTKLTEIFYL